MNEKVKDEKKNKTWKLMGDDLQVINLDPTGRKDMAMTTVVVSNETKSIEASIDVLTSLGTKIGTCILFFLFSW